MTDAASSLLRSPDGLSLALRLEQADDRARYLDALTRGVSALVHPSAALETVVETLTGGLVRAASIVMRTHDGWLWAGQAQGRPLRRTHEQQPSGAQVAVASELMQQQLPEMWVLPPDTPQRERMLAELFGEGPLSRDVDSVAGDLMVHLPLVARGRGFGLLSLVPRPLTAGDDPSSGVAFLEDVADRLAVALDACRVVADNRHTASVLRQSLRPGAVPEGTGLEIATYSRVAQEDLDLGGDFIDVHGPVDDLTLLFGDVAGHGVRAAVTAKRIRGSVRTGSLIDRDPSFLLDLTDRMFATERDELPAGFATALCARARRDGVDLVVDLATAGHPAPLVVRADGTVERPEVRGPALGLGLPGTWDVTSLRLSPGDVVIAFTDGVVETRGPDGLFGEERLAALLGDLAGSAASAFVEALAMEVSGYIDDPEQRDDTTILAVRVLSPGQTGRR